MDDVVNRMAKELAAAIAAAVADDPKVEACRERARAAGYELRLSLEAVVGFMNRSASGTPSAQSNPARTLAARRATEITANDRRFLRSLRIAADEAPKEVE